ncbi:MAG: hypothetical protein ACRYF2_16670 [Janthinobacterium lividum]
MKFKHTLAAVASTAAVAIAQPAAAVTISGGIDPTTGLTLLGSWVLSLVGVAIPVICAFKGAHAVAEGRHLGPYVGSAVGGMVLAFGGAYILNHYGVA